MPRLIATIIVMASKPPRHSTTRQCLGQCRHHSHLSWGRPHCVAGHV